MCTQRVTGRAEIKKNNKVHILIAARSFRNTW